MLFPCNATNIELIIHLMIINNIFNNNNQNQYNFGIIVIIIYHQTKQYFIVTRMQGTNKTNLLSTDSFACFITFISNLVLYYYILLYGFFYF